MILALTDIAIINNTTEIIVNITFFVSIHPTSPTFSETTF